MSDFPEWLRSTRKRKHQTHQQVAFALSVTTVTLSNWEHGRKTPTVATVQRLVNYFKTPFTIHLKPCTK